MKNRRIRTLIITFLETENSRVKSFEMAAISVTLM